MALPAAVVERGTNTQGCCALQYGGRVRLAFFEEASDHCLLDVGRKDAQVRAHSQQTYRLKRSWATTSRGQLVG